MGLAMDRSPYSRTGDRERGCWYYLRYFFLFVSLIQFLIILGLVLFMIYGNVHATTESSLRATEIRADNLYSQVVELSATKANLSKQLNISTLAKETVMQQMLTTRREVDRINASFRQCQGDLITYINYNRFIAAIILSEKQCQEQLKELNKSCEALLFKLGEKVKTLEMEVAKEKAVCSKDKESLLVGKRQAEEQLEACGKARGRQQQEQQVTQEHLHKVQSLCVPLDQEKLQAEVMKVWRDSLVYRNLESIGFHYPLMTEYASLRRTCESLPGIMSTKIEELARELRVGIERVTRENAELRRQKLELERAAQGAQEAQTRAGTEAQARETQLRAECARQTQLALEEKAALRAQRDGLARELEARKREVEQLRTEVDVRISALDTCVKAKSLPAIPPPRVPGPPPNPPPIDPVSLEEFKKKILDSQRPPVVNPAVPPSG